MPSDKDILSDEQIAEIETRKVTDHHIEGGHYIGCYILLSTAERDALCQTVKALRAQLARVDPPAAPDGDKALAQQDHERVTTLLEGTHCPKHGMEWEACCLSEVMLEVHWKVKDLLATVRAEGVNAAFKDCITELCIDCAEGDEPTFDAQAKWYYHEAGTKMEVGCSASKLRICAAALESARTGKVEG